MLKITNTTIRTTKFAKAFLSSIVAVCIGLFMPVAALGTPETSMDVSDQAISSAEQSVAESQSSLDKAKSRLEDLNDECSELESEVKSIQKEIDKTAAKAKKAQSAMLAGRDALSDAMLYEYKNDTVSAYLEILLGSSNINDLTNNMGYITKVMDFHSSEVLKQKQLRKEFNDITDDLNDKLDKQASKLAEMQEMEEEAQTLVDNLASELGAKNEKLNSLKEYAQSLKEANEAATTVEPKAKQVKEGAVPSNNDASQSTSQSTSTSESTSKSSSTSSSTSQSTSQSTSKSDSSESESSGWKTGAASAYGGSSDSYTSNPAYTATGAICDDNSMGVAIPMSWSNYKSLFGHTVVIQYGGKTVYATINDCGGMGGGSRHLDLQPGVFKALGFKTCQAWGVRTVRYKIL